MVGVKVKSPFASVVARPTSMPSMMIATVELGAPTPRMSGLRAAVIAPFAGSVIVTVVATHRPASSPAATHIGLGARQSVAIVGLHGRQSMDIASHTGVAPRQSALVMHAATVNVTLVP
jgi:hypothetical protein